MKNLNLGFSCLVFSTTENCHFQLTIPTYLTLKGAVCPGLDFIGTVHRVKSQTWCQSGAMESDTGDSELQERALLLCLQNSGYCLSTTVDSLVLSIMADKSEPRACHLFKP